MPLQRFGKGFFFEKIFIAIFLESNRMINFKQNR